MDINDRVVIILNNNNSALIMNEKNTKQSIRMYLTRLYDKDNSTMQQFKETLSISKIIK